MDSEKVIKGLECCIGQFPGEDYCKTCAYQPYRFGKCKADAISDALSLLKEQEPHVLTWDEMVEAGKNHVGVYVEEYPNSNRTDRWAIAIEGIEPPEHGYNYPGGTHFNAVDADDDMYDGDLYGLKGVLGWRAWSAKPTEEQMKAVEWK